MEKLAFINEQMNILNIPYEYGEWTKSIQYPYYVGEISSPEDILAEDGAEETTFILTGFHYGKFIELEQDKAKIKQHFNTIFGARAKTNSGAIAVFYDGGFIIPTGEKDLKKIQITLKIKEWKGVN